MPTNVGKVPLIVISDIINICKYVSINSLYSYLFTLRERELEHTQRRKLFGLQG